jgi:transcription elongation factor Elf1
MADLNQAFNIQIKYERKAEEMIKYEFKCIYCHSTNVVVITNDGGSRQMCCVCGRTYVAKNAVKTT